MRKILKYIIIAISSILIFILSGFAIDASVEHIIISSKISAFRDMAVYQEDISTNSIKYYKVTMEDEIPGYMPYGTRMLPGNYGDIITAKNSFIFNEFFSAFKNFNVGAHAAIITKDYKDSKMNATSRDSIEATGLEPDINVAQISDRSYWNDLDYFNEVICLRPKLTEEQKDEVLSVAGGHLGDPYNYSFTFDTLNKSYCSDLLTKVYKHVGIDLNRDGFWTTVLDIIACPDLTVTYYHFTENNVKYVYYVG